MKDLLSRKSLIFHLIMVRFGSESDFIQDDQLQTSKRREYGTKYNGKKKILIVGMSESPHLHNWIDGIAESRIVDEVWLFPSDLPLRRHKKFGFRVHKFPYFMHGFLSKFI